MKTIDAKRLLGLGSALRLGAPGLAFSVASDGTAVLSATSADLLLSVVEPAAFAGAYALSPPALADGPVALRAPEIDGSPTDGSALQAQPALWAYDGAASDPVRSWQWQSDGADIAGATTQSLMPGPDEAGTNVRVVETVAGVNGTRSSASAEVAIPI